MTPQQIIDDLNSLDGNNVGSWPLYVYVSLCVIIFGFVVGITFTQSIEPKLMELEQLEKKEISLREEFESKQRKVANLAAYEAQLEEMERSFGAMLRQLPSKTEVANLLNDISQTRVASGLEEELFQPQQEVRKEFYAEIPNKITVTGTYHEIAMFVSRVSALPRIVTIDNVNLTPLTSAADRRRGADEEVLLKMQAVAKTYRYLDEETQ